MSGTSLDGVDAVITHLVGTGRSMTVDVLAFAHQPYPEALRDLILDASNTGSSSVDAITRLHARLPLAYADAVDAALAAADLNRSDVDLVGSHGQTIQHLPEPSDCAGRAVRGTFQAGNPAALAQHLGIPVVGDFRSADMALGGQGAPLAPYLDDVLFAHSDETRLLLNLGGIANVTVLPAGGATADLRAFDTGPANMVVDALTNRLFSQLYDDNGQIAAAGTPDHDLLADLLVADYFRTQPPKSTGRESFGASYVDQLVEAAQSRNLSNADLVATVTLLTAASVYQAYAQFVRPEYEADALYASGGGVHNDTMMQMLSDAFSPIPVARTSDLEGGVNPDAKEAVLFAVLAHETANGVSTGLPGVTGASASAIQGSLSFPPETTHDAQQPTKSA